LCTASRTPSSSPAMELRQVIPSTCFDCNCAFVCRSSCSAPRKLPPESFC
jgi:radical SAM protein with 4Fe4S-binding SPASM domain